MVENLNGNLPFYYHFVYHIQVTQPRRIHHGFVICLLLLINFVLFLKKHLSLLMLRPKIKNTSPGVRAWRKSMLGYMPNFKVVQK